MKNTIEYQIKEGNNWVYCSRSTYNRRAKENSYNAQQRNIAKTPHWTYAHAVVGRITNQDILDYLYNPASIDEKKAWAISQVEPDADTTTCVEVGKTQRFWNNADRLKFCRNIKKLLKN